MAEVVVTLSIFGAVQIGTLIWFLSMISTKVNNVCDRVDFMEVEQKKHADELSNLRVDTAALKALSR